MSNAFEQVGRLRKVAALVALLQAHKIPATRVEAMDYGEWVALAAKAKVKPPSADTQAAVIADLHRAERMVQSVATTFPAPIAPRGFASIGPGMVVRVGRQR